MKANIILALVFIFLPTIHHAQDIIISGQVNNESQVPLQAEIALIDSSQKLLQVKHTNDGIFKIEVNQPGEYRLFVSSENYNDHDTLLKISGVNLQLGILILKKETSILKQANVKAKRKTFEKTVDGLKIDVEQSYLSKSVNSGELLNRLPGVSLLQNKAQVFGRGEALIIVNNKETTLESFKSIPPSEIKSVEIVQNPDSKYDAKAKALIIVQLKKGYLEGYTATISENLTMSRAATSLKLYNLNAANLTFNYKKNKLNTSFYYANEYGKTWSENIFSNTINAAQQTYFTNGHYAEDNYNQGVHYYNMGLSYDINKNSYISAQYDGIYHNFDLDVNQDSRYANNMGDTTHILMHNDANTRLINHSGNINYYVKLNDLGSSLFIGAQYNNFQNRLQDNIREEISSTNLNAFDRRNRGLNTIDLSTMQIDYTLKMTRYTLEYGAKYYSISNQGRINFFSKAVDENTFNENAQLANATKYNEKVPAVYYNVRSEFRKIKYTVGLRMEYTFVEGYSFKTESKFLDSNYINIFPSLKANYKLNDNWSVSTAYGRKINRPLYQDLDPFLWYLDSLSSIQGNPKLQPEYLNQFEIKLSYKQCALRLNFSQAHNAIWAITQLGYSGPNSTVYIKTNFQQKHTLNIAFDIPVEHKQYSSFSTIALNYYKFIDKRPEFSTQQSKPQLYVYSYHRFNIKNWFTCDLSAEYYGKTADGFTQRLPYYYACLGISRAFFHDNLSAQILANDIFRTAKWQGTRTIHTYTNSYNQRNNSQFIRLSLSYKLGALRTANYQNKAVNEKEFNRIKK